MNHACGDDRDRLSERVNWSHVVAGSIMIACILLCAARNDVLAASLSLSISRVNTLQFPQIDADFTLSDDSGRPIAGLSGNELLVSIDGQRSESFSLTPIRRDKLRERIVFVVNNSETMLGDAFYRARTAIREIVTRLAPEDEIALVTCGNGVELLQDLTQEKFGIGRLLNELSIVDGTVSLPRIINDLFLIWDDSMLQGATIVIVNADMEQGNETALSPLATRLRDASITVVGLSVQSPQQSIDMRNMFTVLGAGFVIYQKPADVWNLVKAVDTKSEGNYRLVLNSGLNRDYAIHSLKVVVELFGVSAGESAMFLGSPSDGVAPQTILRNYFYRTPVFMLFVMTITSFGCVFLLFLVERLFMKRAVRWTAYPFVAATGIMIGLLVAWLLMFIPR